MSIFSWLDKPQNDSHTSVTHFWLLPKQLTPEQEAHNLKVDYEIKMRDAEWEEREAINRLKMAEWEKFLEKNPDHPFKACPGLDMTSKRKIIAIKYVC